MTTGETFRKRKVVLMLDEYEIAAVRHALKDSEGAAARVGEWLERSWEADLGSKSSAGVPQRETTGWRDGGERKKVLRMWKKGSA